MKKTRFLYAMMAVLMALACTACGKDTHEDEYPLDDGQGAFIVGLVGDRTIGNLNLFLFGDEGTAVVRKDYDDPRALASEYIPVAAGGYTLVVVANVTDGGLSENTTVAGLAEWLKEHEADWPDLCTASAQATVAAGEVKRLLLTLQGGTEGIGLADLTLRLTVPDQEMPDYATRAGADGDYSLRLVAEVYEKGTGARVHRSTRLCTPQADGTCTATLSLLKGDYDLRLWADRSADRYYDTDDLSAVTLLTDGYVANGQTDEKDAWYAVQTVTLEGAAEQPVTLVRPFARYRIVATDVEGYLNLIAKGEDLPPMEDLQASVSYEGFLPTAFNVVTGLPTDALQGISYEAGIVAAEGYPEDEARQVGADFVLTGDEDSFVTVTVRMTDRTTGETVSTVAGVKIPYRRGELTTVTGTFLTAGRTSGGVTIDISWGKDDIVIPF